MQNNNNNNTQKSKNFKNSDKRLNVFSVYLNQNISCSWNIIEYTATIHIIFLIILIIKKCNIFFFE